jgi:hypothetical protein
VKQVCFTAFTSRSHPRQNFEAFLISECGHCRTPVIAEVYLDPAHPRAAEVRRGGYSIITLIEQMHGDVEFPERRLGIYRIYPELPRIDAPDALPSTVNQDFLDAKATLLDGRYRLAVSGLRNVLEAALKDFPEVKGRATLNDRIDALADAGLLTSALKEWSHAVRLIGNEATHDAAPTKEQAEDLLHLVEMILLYLFSMPAKVKALRPATAP